MDKYIFKCPFCEEQYYTSDKKRAKTAKANLYRHMEEEHEQMLGGLPPSQVYFNLKYHKNGSKCVICKTGDCKWNEVTERYERFCSDKCKKKYREEFLKRMKKAGKENQMNDPEHQKKMLAGRSISGKYKFEDGGEVAYVGSYEREFLEFLDTVMNFNSSDIMGPAPQIFYYEYKGQKHFYIPDFYITSLNLLIEIKDGEDNPNKHHKIQEVDKEKEKIKDSIMYNQKQYEYLKIMDKNYSTFINYLLDKKVKE